MPFVICTVAVVLVLGSVSRAWSCDAPVVKGPHTPAEVRAFFAAQRKLVVTFFGYSGAEYEDKAAMLAQAAKVLSGFDPRRTIVNIGATAEGIGAVYEVAAARGFQTTGIVSTQARDNQVALAPCAGTVFYVTDGAWGGFIEGSERLSPTSTAMVEVSDHLIAIGGGDVVRDELTAARRLRKRVQFFPADMNHALAIEKARKAGQPTPADFRGSAALQFR